MFNWLRTKKALHEEGVQLKNRVDIAEAQIRILQRKLDTANAQLSAAIRSKIRQAPLPVSKKVDHRFLQAQQTIPEKKSTYGSSINSSPGLRAGSDLDPIDALTAVALGAGAAMVLGEIFSSDTSTPSPQDNTTPDFTSGGGGDFGGWGDASSTWD